MFLIAYKPRKKEQKKTSILQQSVHQTNHYIYVTTITTKMHKV
jgi:hypothetical protein